MMLEDAMLSRLALAEPSQRLRQLDADLDRVRAALTWLPVSAPWWTCLEGDSTMPDTEHPADYHALIAAIDERVFRLKAARQDATEQIDTRDSEQAPLGHHPNYAAYIPGGMLEDKQFGVDHILAVAGFHTLGWREALARLEAAPDCDDEPRCLLIRLRNACEIDPMLEIAGQAFFAERDQLKCGDIDPYWLKRPRLGLGQAANAFGVEPTHAEAHRGLYALPLAALRRGFENAATNQSDQRFGAMLVPVIEAGGNRLARIGAAAIHRDAETRYREDCKRFAAHQRANPSRQWRWKPALSRQGHLAVTTARAKEIALPSERTRGHAATWLDDHDANIRFTHED